MPSRPWPHGPSSARPLAAPAGYGCGSHAPTSSGARSATATGPSHSPRDCTSASQAPVDPEPLEGHQVTMTFVDQPLVHVFLEGHYGPYQDQLMRWKIRCPLQCSKAISQCLAQSTVCSMTTSKAIFGLLVQKPLWPTSMSYN